MNRPFQRERVKKPAYNLSKINVGTPDERWITDCDPNFAGTVATELLFPDPNRQNPAVHSMARTLDNEINSDGDGDFDDGYDDERNGSNRSYHNPQ